MTVACNAVSIFPPYILFFINSQKRTGLSKWTLCPLFCSNQWHDVLCARRSLSVQQVKMHDFIRDASPMTHLWLYTEPKDSSELSMVLFVKIHLHLCHGRALTAPSHTEGCCDLASRLMSTYWRQRYCLCSHSLCPVRFRKDSSLWLECLSPALPGTQVPLWAILATWISLWECEIKGANNNLMRASLYDSNVMYHFLPMSLPVRYDRPKTGLCGNGRLLFHHNSPT